MRSPPPLSVHSDFGVRAEVVGDQRVGGVEDVLRGPVVLVEHDHRGVGERLFELEDVADVGAAEPVDRLVGVADHAHVVVLRAEQHHEFVLRLVRVLVLVDQDVLEAVLPLLQRLLVDLQQVDRDHQQVVEVHRVRGGEAALVLGVGGRDQLALGRATRALGCTCRSR